MWVISMIGTGFLSFGAFCLLPFIDSMELRIAISFVFAFFAGLAAGCGGMIGPSVQSDIVDYDELVSGERKEGPTCSMELCTKECSGSYVTSHWVCAAVQWICAKY